MLAKPLDVARLLVLVVCAATLGCRTVYDAGSLPAEFAAPLPTSAFNQDLSWLKGAAAEADMIYPGDAVQVSLATSLERQPVTWTARVRNDGTAHIPLVGPVRFAGYRLSEAEREITEASRQRNIYRNPNVAVTFSDRLTNRITVLGAVNSPGTYELPAGKCDVLGAVMAGGGPTEDAGRYIDVRHAEATDRLGSGGAPVTRIDLQDGKILGPPDFQLSDGSVVTVEKRPKRQISVRGMVRKPDRYAMPPNTDLRMLDALALAGDRSWAIADKVTIVRQVPGREKPIVIKSSVRKAERNESDNVRLAPGDVVNVEETPLLFVLGTLKSLIYIGGSIPLY